LTAALLVGMGVLVLVNGFFVAAEFALVRARRGRLGELSASSRGAAIAWRQLDDISRYLAACQFGITLASLGIGFLGEPAIASLAEPVLGNVLSHGVAVGVALAIAYLLSTAAHITVGEQVPKLYAIENAELVARRVALPLGVFTRIFGPAIGLLDRTSNALLRPLGVKGGHAEERAGGAEEVRQLIAESVAGGGLEREAAEMLSGVFRLRELTAREVMTPAPAVVWVAVEETAETALDRCLETGHTRLLAVRDEHGDEAVGAVHVNDLARAVRAGGDSRVADLVRSVPVVPETRALDALLGDLQRDRASLAAVIDEYGRTSGIVTVEDIVEEVVGEIVDETDPAGAAVRRLPGGDLFVRGHVALADLEDYGISLSDPPEGVVSIGGWVFARLGRLPRRGDVLEDRDIEITVDSVREHRVDAVLMATRAPAVAPEPLSRPRHAGGADPA
jgi:CBS domain containing-hemolysin-like protein